ncbi:MAG TPA: RES family NAD+ phosphorylase [Acetobacteraceae bacterium]|nr:RES family NAD+ phosphorylase [Acetobacteraceae bacterium]
MPQRRVVWQPSWRIVPSRFPPIDLFERIADPADWEALISVESLTNDRIRDAVGDIALVPPEERVGGPGASIVMAAFTHLNPDGSRFSDGSFGVFYAAADLATAVTETRHHRARFMRATSQPPMELDMRVYVVDLDGELHDIGGLRQAMAAVYDPDDYAPGQALARRLRAAGSSGIVYDSVRRAGGACAAVFRPRCLTNPRQERHLCYVWDGRTIAAVGEKRAV